VHVFGKQFDAGQRRTENNNFMARSSDFGGGTQKKGVYVKMAVSQKWSETAGWMCV